MTGSTVDCRPLGSAPSRACALPCRRLDTTGHATRMSKLHASGSCCDSGDVLDEGRLLDPPGGPWKSGDYATSPYCFILRQSVTVLIFSASAAWRRFPPKPLERALDHGAFLRLKVEAVVAGRWRVFCDTSGGSSRTLMLVPWATMTARSMACSSSRTLPGQL